MNQKFFFFYFLFQSEKYITFHFPIINILVSTDIFVTNTIIRKT